MTSLFTDQTLVNIKSYLFLEDTSEIICVLSRWACAPHLYFSQMSLHFSVATGLQQSSSNYKWTAFLSHIRYGH